MYKYIYRLGNDYVQLVWRLSERQNSGRGGDLAAILLLSLVVFALFAGLLLDEVGRQGQQSVALAQVSGPDVSWSDLHRVVTWEPAPFSIAHPLALIPTYGAQQQQQQQVDQPFASISTSNKCVGKEHVHLMLVVSRQTDRQTDRQIERERER